MASVFDELMDEIGSPQLFAQLGRPVTHYPANIIANAATVTAIWTPMTAAENAKEGRSNERMGVLQVASSVVIDSRDLWEIDGVKYSAGPWKDLPGGMKQSDLKTVNQEYTQPSSGHGKY